MTHGDEPTHGHFARVRLVDVATRAGVTKSVASRVLNADPSLAVRQETRERVMVAARMLGYRAHSGARALAGADAHALALLMPDLTNPVYSRIIRGAYQRARERGYVVLLAEDTANNEADETFAELVESGRVDGLLIASARPGHRLVTSESMHDVPHVFVNRAAPGSGRNVTMDLPAASKAAVDRLVELGHRRVGHVAGPDELEPARAREQGFDAAAQDHRLAAAPVEHGAFSEPGGAQAAARMLRRNPHLTALYCSTLSQAVGTMHAVRESGRSIPGAISVISYDDLPLADFLDPPLTTVAMPLLELGAAAVDALLAQLDGEPPRDVIIPTTPAVVARRSTAPPRPQVQTKGNRHER